MLILSVVSNVDMYVRVICKGVENTLILLLGLDRAIMFRVLCNLLV